jgi:hypothetical protein
MPTIPGQSNDLGDRVIDTLRTEIDATKRLPEKVFVGAWEEYFFFDSDWMFESTFVERLKGVLEIEGGAWACICNLDALNTSEPNTSRFLVDRSTPSGAYAEVLTGTQEKPGWTYRLDRFVCVSDLGVWSIYCERQNEIAVIAVKRDLARGARERLVSAVKALPIKTAIEQSHIYGLSAKALSADWRRALLANYSAGVQGTGG